MDSHTCPPSDEEIQAQSLKTMIAMERMANAITDHLTADKQPAEQTTSSPDYSSLRAACKTCKGIVAFSDYTRVPNSHHDTCTCSASSISHLDVPLNVIAVYEAIHKARLTPPIVACPRCKRPSVVTDPTKLCTLCMSNAQRKNWKKAGDDADYFFKGNVVVTGNLRVEKNAVVNGSKMTAPTESIPGPMAPLDSDLKEIRETLDKHRKALGLIATFGQFRDVGFFGTEPKQALSRLTKLRACPECVGTGWLARDESCKNCKTRGYLET